jgi:aspartate aminotransferase
MRAVLPSELEALIAPQERYQRLHDAAYQRWGHQLCDLSYANFNGGPPSVVLEALRDSIARLRPFDLQYTPYGGSAITRRLIAQRLTRPAGPRFPWRNVILTPGAMAALNLVFRALTFGNFSPEAIVVVPCWLDYPLYLANLGIRAVPAPLDAETLRLDLDRIDAAITSQTRAVILSQPANPTGAVYTRQELAALAGVLHARSGGRILLVSDECHRDVTFGGGEVVSPAEVYENTCVIYSFGKAFQIQGQRIGYVAVSPAMEQADAFARLLESLCRVMGFCTPTSLMQLAVRKLISVDLDLEPIARRRELAIESLRESGYWVRPSDATYFLYPRSPVADDFAFVERMADRGVLALPSSVFHHRGHFRLSLTASDAHVERALEALAGGRGSSTVKSYVSYRAEARN